MVTSDMGNFLVLNPDSVSGWLLFKKKASVKYLKYILVISKKLLSETGRPRMFSRAGSTPWIFGNPKAAWTPKLLAGLGSVNQLNYRVDCFQSSVIKDDSFPFSNDFSSCWRDSRFDPEQIAYWVSLLLFHPMCVNEIKESPVLPP